MAMQRWSMRVAVVAGVAFLALAVAIGLREAHAPGAAGETAAAADLPPPVPAAVARRRLAGSPPALAAVHRQAGRLLAGDLGARLKDLRGYPVVLNVWASWCPPCRAELPLFSRAAAQFGRRVAFLGADVGDNGDQARRLLDETPLSYPSYATSVSAVRALGPVQGTPVTIFFDASGRPAGTHIGAYPSSAELAADIRARTG
jgi:thiol-disulfide isomerase/thioredoxin